MHEIASDLSDAEFEALRQAADMAGMPLDEYVTHAARSEFRDRYVLPQSGGKVIPFRGLKRGDPCP